jgi:RNA polymerase sigma-70 factor (ECF subfamily)
MDSGPDLAQKAADGDRDAYAALVRQFMDPVFRLTLRMTGNEEDARELSQETFIRAFEALGTYDPTRPFFQWLYAISLNLSRDYLRKSRRSRGVFPARPERVEASNSEPAGRTPEALLIREEEEKQMQAGIGRLPIRLREAVLLRYMEELPFEAVAGVLGISVSAAKMRVHRAIQRLREEMGDSL